MKEVKITPSYSQTAEYPLFFAPNRQSDKDEKELTQGSILLGYSSIQSIMFDILNNFYLQEAASFIQPIPASQFSAGGLATKLSPIDVVCAVLARVPHYQAQEIAMPQPRGPPPRLRPLF